MNSKVIASLTTQKKGKLQIQIDIFEKVNDTDIGNPVEIRETINSRSMPMAKGYLNLRTASNDESIKWFTLHTLSRETDSFGDYELKSKTNKNGELIDENYQVVSNEDDAAIDFEFASIDNKKFYINKAVVYLNNSNKSTGKEFKETICNVKYFSEQEAAHIKSLNELLKVEQEQEDRDEIIKELKSLKHEYGQYITMFISDGFDFFKANGFEVREQQNKKQYKNKTFGDNIPF